MSGLDARLALAARMLRHDPRLAVEHARGVLAEEPALAEAHALLALALVQTKRIFAAEHEAREALRLEPMLAQGHHALGAALFAQRRTAPAEASLREAIAQSPNRAVYRLALAGLLKADGRREEARTLLHRAIALEPDDVGAHCALGELWMELGNLPEAKRCAEAAGELEPGAVEAIVLRGQIALREGKSEEARELALWALSSDADDGDALRLLVDVKARSGWLLGLWWRYLVWMVKKSDRGQIVTLIGAFLFVQLAAQAAEDLKQPGAATVIRILWLGLVVYSFTAPRLYQRLMSREQQSVRLRDDF